MKVRTLILLPTVQLHFQQKPATTGLIRYKHSTRANHLAREKTDGKLLKPWDNTRKSSTLLHPSFPWLTPKNLDSPSVLIFFSNTRNKQKNSSIRHIRLKVCLTVGQLPIKAGWRDAHFALPDFSRSNKYVRSLSLNWKFWFYGPNLFKKGISASTQISA